MANALLDALPGYAATGPAVSDPSERHPGNVILYRTNTLECIESREIWLSETPDVLFSKHPSAALARTCIDAAFVDRASGRHFRVLNTHLDNASNEARVFGAETILNRIVRPTKTRGELMFMTGDFNSRLDKADTAESFAAFTKSALKMVSGKNAVASLLVELDDTFALANGCHKGPFRTFRGWGVDDPVWRIDYVLVSPKIKVLRHETLMDRYNGFFPSDHCPVVAEVEF